MADCTHPTITSVKAGEWICSLCQSPMAVTPGPRTQSFELKAAVKLAVNYAEGEERPSDDEIREVLIEVVNERLDGETFYVSFEDEEGEYEVEYEINSFEVS